MSTPGDFETLNVASGILQKVSLPVVSNEVCDGPDYYNGSIAINERFICAGDKKTNACKGDSGGGLFVRARRSDTSSTRPYMMLGVVSFGSRRGNCGDPTVFTRVAEYIDWIRQNIED